MNSFWVLPSDTIGRRGRAWRPNPATRACPAPLDARDARRSHESPFAAFLLYFRAWASPLMRRDLPVLLDGDHYIPMKTPRRLEKATLSLQLSFVCSSFRPLPIPPLFDQTLLLRALLIAPPASARPTSRAALFCRPCHLPNPGHSVQLTFTRLLAFPAGCADGSGFCSQVRLRLFLHKYGLKPVRQFGLAQLRTAPLLHQRYRP